MKASRKVQLPTAKPMDLSDYQDGRRGMESPCDIGSAVVSVHLKGTPYVPRSRVGA